MKLFKKDELRLLWPFYLMVFLAGAFSVVFPIWIIFFQQKFTYLQISFALAISSAAMILFEIPTGAFADIFGRKSSVILSLILRSLVWFVLPFVSTPFILYTAFFFIGVFMTFKSGADEAWIIDWLKHNKKENLIHEMYIKIQSIHSIGFVIGPLLTTLLLFFLEMKHLFFVEGSGALFISLMLIFFAKEYFVRRKAKLREKAYHTIKTIKRGTSYLFSHKTLFYLIIAEMAIAFAQEFNIVAWQPLLVDLALPVQYLGLIFSAVSVIGIATPFLTKKLLKQIGYEKHYLALTTALQFLALISLCFIERPFFLLGVAVFLLINIMADLRLPVRSMYFQSFVPNKIRATTTSTQSMILSAVAFFVIVAGGYIIDKIGPKMAIVAFAFFLIPATIFYLLIKNK
ncbi:MAG: MFS transporter [Candidatus Pacearchaeota archaeon]